MFQHLKEKVRGEAPDRVYNIRYILRKRIPNLAQDLDILQESGEKELVQEMSDELLGVLHLKSEIEARVEEIEERLEE